MITDPLGDLIAGGFGPPIAEPPVPAPTPTAPAPARSSGLSEFDEAMSEAFAESIEFFGVATFRFRSLTLTGDLSDLSADEKLAIGGAVPNVKQTLMFARQVFTPAIRTGEYVQIGERKLRIGLVESDRTTITLYLCSPDE